MISVVIPLYNKELAIEQSLKSVLTQSCDDFEVVIVDDGSTDGSVSIVEGFDDSRIRLFHQDNSGPSKARNTGVKHAQGEWIVFLDADDELTKGALQMMVDELKKYPEADIIDFNGYIKTGNNQILRSHPLTGRISNPLRAFYFRQISPGCGHSIFRTTLLEDYPYDERMRRFEDSDILLRLLPNARVYSSLCITEIHVVDFVEASLPRKNVMEDYFAYLDFSKGGFWHKMCIYRTFLENREIYPEYGKKHYASLYWRYDLLLIYKILNWLGRFMNK